MRISDQNGFVAATVQLGKFPPTPATGILKDGDMLVLTGTRLENGQPIRVVMSLLLDGDTMHPAQMLEASQTIKRGSGRRVANEPETRLCSSRENRFEKTGTTSSVVPKTLSQQNGTRCLAVKHDQIHNRGCETVSGQVCFAAVRHGGCYLAPHGLEVVWV